MQVLFWLAYAISVAINLVVFVKDMERDGPRLKTMIQLKAGEMKTPNGSKWLLTYGPYFVSAAFMAVIAAGFFVWPVLFFFNVARMVRPKSNDVD